MPKLVLICKEQTIMWQIDNFAIKKHLNQLKYGQKLSSTTSKTQIPQWISI